MWGQMTVEGHFAEARGDGQVTDTGAVSGRVDIVAASLHSGVRKRVIWSPFRGRLRMRENSGAVAHRGRSVIGAGEPVNECDPGSRWWGCALLP